MVSPRFRTRARLLNQLGEQLIKNESIALLELIKNSYDADASNCLIEMKSIEDPDNGVITILDDGSGMDSDILEKIWLEIGTSHKAEAKETNSRSEVHHRIPLGEKGIGRLGAHRLGKEIEIISRMKGRAECRLFINWDKINTSQFIEDLPVTIEDREPTEFKNASGTLIIIRRLKGEWTRRSVRECARAVNSLNSPFDEVGAFKASLSVPGSDWLEGIATFQDIEQFKLFSFDATISGNEISKFAYSFTPFPTMPHLAPRSLGLDDIKPLQRMVGVDDGKEIHLDPDEIGTINFKGVIFDLSSKVLAAGVQDKAGLKEYLRENGGVRVFRDKMRVWDYGEKGNDWLELDIQRVNKPSFKLSNNLILGAVYLDSSSSSGLIEKANREGFVSNSHFSCFVKACKFLVERIELLREKDKELLRLYYGASRKSEPVLHSLSEVKIVVDRHVKDKSAREEIARYLERIQQDYETITANLIKSAGAGLNLTVVIHQMQKIIKNILSGIRGRVSLEKLEEQVKQLSALVEGYSILVRKSEIKSRNLAGAIKDASFNASFRLEDHGVDLVLPKKEQVINAVFSESHVAAALLNLFDNSIWWLKYSKIKTPKIYIDISAEMPGYQTVIFADNGPGFAIPTEQLCKPFISAKPGGIGIGLHLTGEIMNALKGKILFPDWGEFAIPEEYKGGAIVALAFKKVAK
ncbi:MAG TPA: ATP-binding protein [Fibrobacteria bacterium]|nr:ATP-binding protein [Fibrobacteria bacterium]